METVLGAEAKISKIEGKIVKERIKKYYRLSQIDDKLRVRRTRLETNLLREARRIGVCVPRVIDSTQYKIEMEEIEGSVVKNILNEKNFKYIGKEIGRQIGLLHEYDVIHGDLTTSNMIVEKSHNTNSYSSNSQIKNSSVSQSHDKNNSSSKDQIKNSFLQAKSQSKIYFIDFGLGFHSQRIEDKAIDLYLFYHSIESTHWILLDKFWRIILNSYKSHFLGADKVIKALYQIEKRGRYKTRDVI